MSDNFGTGVSRVLDPQQTGYLQVIHQEGKCPLDSEINLVNQVSIETTRQLALRGTPSGWYGDAVNPQDSFVTNVNWSNWFRFGPQLANEKQAIMYANVNGWQIPVTGTLTGFPPGNPDSSTWNRITLPPPPANTGDARIDFVFLEVWKAKIAPNPSTTNKPAAAAIYRFGNVEGGYSFITDDLQDPEIGFETSQRVQLQYRIRIVSGLVGLASYPDGFDPSVVKGQGAATNPTSYIFENMRKELGDCGLWRSGDGTQNALGTVDGYVYAIPIAAVFRRNSVAWDVSNLNGGISRNPTAVDRTGYRTFATVPTLIAGITATATSLTLTSVANLPLPLTPASPLLIQIGDEIMTYTAITGTTMSGLARAQNGSIAEAHVAGSVVKLLAIRPDGLYTDQVTQDDILDLRHVVNPGGFDYQALLKGAFDRLLRGGLKSTWKRASNCQGPVIPYVDYISASVGPLGTTQLDSPDNIRVMWGNPALLQPVVIPFPPCLSTVTTTPVSYAVELDASYTIDALAVFSGGTYAPNDQYRIPLAQFLTSLPGSDNDQLNIPSSQTYVTLRFQGESTDLPAAQYTVAHDVNGNLLVTLTGSFVASGVRNTNKAFLTFHLQYGPGRGLSRRPDAVHTVAYLASTSRMLTQPQGIATNQQPLRAAYVPLWSKYRHSKFNGQLPVTTECYVDPGSGTVILTPYKLQGVDGPNFSLIGYQKASPSDSQLGAMPTRSLAGVTKYTTVDPLNLFRSHLYASDYSRVVTLPRKLVPSWGAVQIPIKPVDSGSFYEGANFMFQAPKGSTLGSSVTTYSPLNFVGGSNTYGIFSTRNLSFPTPVPAVYNAAATASGVVYAGARLFTDVDGLGRQGIELPPFLGCCRIFGIFSAEDYRLHGSPYDPSSRARTTTGATNLLRQQYNGDTVYITLDSDGDSTFVVNAEVIDISKSPDGLTDFASSHFVVECSIFGFDRGCFDGVSDARIVITREATAAIAGSMVLPNPTFILPGAADVGSSVIVNYSRTVDQSDPWFSQTTGTDTGYSAGPLTTATRYQLLTTSLDYANLARPNQKVLEVLTGMAFQTTLGTGRLSGDIPPNDLADFRCVGYEVWSIPTTPIDPRPNILQSALIPVERALTVGTAYLGCVDRLPLGSLFKSHNFRGNVLGGASGSDLRQLITGVWYSPATTCDNMMPAGNTDFVTVPVQGASMASGNAGEIVVHVDGSTGNYGTLTTFRTNRGGSAFTVSGLPGGDLGAILPTSQLTLTYGGILSGVAMLVRNMPTSVGAVESSAGQELMLMVTTTARAQGTVNTLNTVQIGTSGTGEGYSASSIYRLSGHPLTNDPARSMVDPTTITLARKSDLL